MLLGKLIINFNSRIRLIFGVTYQNEFEDVKRQKAALVVVVHFVQHCL